MPRGSAVALLMLSACAPGHLEWANGDDDVRTALWVERTNGMNDEILLFLSTSQLGCQFPNEADTENGESVVENQVDQDAYFYGLCREDARHVLLYLYRPLNSDLVGRYTGDDRGPLDPIEDGP